MNKKTTIKKTKRKKSNILPVILIAVLIVVLLYAALQFHFIITPKGLEVCQKTELTLEDTFADVRGWGPLEYLQHPRIAMARLNKKKALTKDTLKEMKKNFKKNKKSLEKNLEKELDKLFEN